MSDSQNVTIQLVAGPRGEEAAAALGDSLGTPLGERDEQGVVDVSVEAGDTDEAVRRVVDAIAASGVEEQVTVLEHPGEREHWHRADRAADEPGGALG